MNDTPNQPRGRCPIAGCPMVFRVSHLGIDGHVLKFHGHLFDGSTKHDRYADFKRMYPRPWPFASEEEFQARHAAGAGTVRKIPASSREAPVRLLRGED